ncbi:transposase [Enterococcus faecalis]|nr:transposase [Enterococcus faecalis]EIT2196998.1 transposase [Enterococcus faecalis]ELY8689034.1 transposase [Enterococcus faecalis]NSN09529.1 transposase [Enterococcus faecalis]NSP60527.1 transposase [Enterococcus faecalis]
MIKKIFDENKGNYGYRRIQLALKEQGLNVNQKKIHRLMRKLGLKGKKFIRKSRKYNSYKGTVGYGEKNVYIVVSTLQYPIQIPLNLSIMNVIKVEIFK